MAILDDIGLDNSSAGLLGMSLLNKGSSSGGGLLNTMLMMKMLGGDETATPTMPNPATQKPNYLVDIPPVENTIPRLAYAIGQLESGGKYDVLGPVTKSGDRAYGRYQVMGNNVPNWTRQVLGQSMTPDEFLNNPYAQDQVANHFLSNYYKQYGNIDDAAAMWFSGRPARRNNSKDVLGTSVPKYIQTVNKIYYGK